MTDGIVFCLLRFQNSQHNKKSIINSINCAYVRMTIFSKLVSSFCLQIKK